MSIESDAKIRDLERRVEALEKRLRMSTQDLCDEITAKLDQQRKTLTLPEKRKSA